jgi:hypothetical protein
MRRLNASTTSGQNGEAEGDMQGNPDPASKRGTAAAASVAESKKEINSKEKKKRDRKKGK